MKAERFYYAAAYLRLSRNDVSDGSNTESNSISSQRELIHSYICRQDDMELYDYYVDEGISAAYNYVLAGTGGEPEYFRKLYLGYGVVSEIRQVRRKMGDC